MMKTCKTTNQPGSVKELTEALGEALDWIAIRVADDPKEYHEEIDKKWRKIQSVYAKYAEHK